jgi:hypothetical protein
MAKVQVVGDQIQLKLSIWEKLGALHGDLNAPIAAISKVEFAEKLWGSETLRGVRAPGTALPYVVLLGTLRGLKYRDFVAMKGRGEGAIITFSEGPFARWIFTLEQPKAEIEALGSDTPGR